MTRSARGLSLFVVCLLLASAAVLRSADAIPGIDAPGMDRAVKPGDDFYRFANGTWLRNSDIPADRGSIGASLVAGERAEARLTEIVRMAASGNAPPGSDLRKIGDFYRSYLDTTAIEAAGLAPIRPLLSEIAAIGDRRALARVLGLALRADVDVINDGALDTDNLFGLWVDQDFDDPSRNFAALLQGGLAMPDPRYYLEDSPPMADIRQKYRAHISAMLNLAGVTGALEKADAILALETKIARVHTSREDTWDVLKGNNHWSRSDFSVKAPGLDWDAFFSAAGLGDVKTFVAWQPSAITGLSALVDREELESWKALLTYHAIEHHADVLPAAIDREAFEFFGKTLNGTPAQAPRERRAVDVTSQAIGFAVGREYVERYFPARAKQQVEQMVAGILRAFDARIDALAWMAPATKAEAKAKLKTLKVSVGYPDRWPSYAGLDVVAGDAFGNADRVERFQYRQNLAKLRGPVNRDEWSMTPQLVNAVNMPAMNAMNFPAGILQPPFFDPARSDAMNYAAVGAVIGHEISHSFDNLGANFDSRGRLRNWWTPDDLAHFTAAGEQLVRQFDLYKPFPDLAVNGRLTLAENIADLAGLTAAYDAYHASRGDKAAPVVGGLSADQQFFVSFAQIWRRKMRDGLLRQMVLTNGHAPAQYRALIVRNLDAWYRAFAVEPGQREYLSPPDRVRIW